jgi:hypothetical protein
VTGCPRISNIPATGKRVEEKGQYENRIENKPICARLNGQIRSHSPDRDASDPAITIPDA